MSKVKIATIHELIQHMMLCKEPRAGKPSGGLIIVGAGASRNANIPTASEVAFELGMIVAKQRGKLNPSAKNASELFPILLEKNLIPRKIIDNHINYDAIGITPERDTTENDLYDIFMSDDFFRFRANNIISNIISRSGTKINFFYPALGTLFKAHLLHTAVTTNFDQLIKEGLALSNIIPDEFSSFEQFPAISENPTSPQVVFLHGTKNTYAQTHTLKDIKRVIRHPAVYSKLVSLFYEADFILSVGYSGNDQGLIDVINESLHKVNYTKPIYWCCYEKSIENINKSVVNLFSTTTPDGSLLPGGIILNVDADDLMREMLQKLQLAPPTTRDESPFRKSTIDREPNSEISAMMMLRSALKPYPHRDKSPDTPPQRLNNVQSSVSLHLSEDGEEILRNRRWLTIETVSGEKFIYPPDFFVVQKNIFSSETKKTSDVFPEFQKLINYFNRRSNIISQDSKLTTHDEVQKISKCQNLCVAIMKKSRIFIDKIKQTTNNHMQLNYFINVYNCAGIMYAITYTYTSRIENSPPTKITNLTRANTIYDALTREEKNMDNKMLFQIYLNHAISIREKGFFSSERAMYELALRTLNTSYNFVKLTSNIDAISCIKLIQTSTNLMIADSIFGNENTTDDDRKRCFDWICSGLKSGQECISMIMKHIDGKDPTLHENKILQVRHAFTTIDYFSLFKMGHLLALEGKNIALIQEHLDAISKSLEVAQSNSSLLSLDKTKKMLSEAKSNMDSIVKSKK